MGLLGFWPWWCVWVGQDCSCPDSWCILTEKCWGGAAPATSSPAAGRSRPCPIWRWSRPYRRRHPTASPSCPLRQRSAECCRGSSWPAEHKAETKRDLLGILTGWQKPCSCIRYHRAHKDNICWNNAGKNTYSIDSSVVSFLSTQRTNFLTSTSITNQYLEMAPDCVSGLHLHTFWWVFLEE